MTLEDLKPEAEQIVARLKEALDDEHAIAIVHVSLVLAYKSAMANRYQANDN